jgi:hypothetical protein
MVTLESFIIHVGPHLPGCPEEVILDAIRDSCIRFCTDTWVIRETLQAFLADSDEDTYTLTPLSGDAVVGIVSFRFDEIELTKTTEEELDVLDFGWRSADAGNPTMVTSPDESGIVRLNRKAIVGTTSEMRVRVATKPQSDADEVQDALLNEWFRAVKYGALELLYEIPGKGWSDQKQSRWYGKRFNFEIQRGKARARMGHMTKSTVARSRAWI